MEFAMNARIVVVITVIAGAAIVAAFFTINDENRSSKRVEVSPKALGWTPCADPVRDAPIDSRHIDSVVVSGASQRVYVTTQKRELFIGKNTRSFTWTKPGYRTPGPLYAVAGRNKDVIYAISGSVFRSANEGRTWRSITCDGGVIPQDVTLPQKTPSIVYIALTLPEEGTSPEYGGLYRSMNDGDTWMHITRFYPRAIQEELGDLALEIDDVMVNPRSPRRVYLTTEGGGVLTSYNYGLNWRYSEIDHVRALDSRYGRLTAWSLSIGAGARPSVWIATRVGIYRGDEDGTKWSRRSSRKDILQVVPDARDARTVIALTTRGVTVRTSDAGRQWRRIEALPRKLEGLVNERSHDVYYAWTATTVFRSRDRGMTWEELPPLPG